MAKLYANENFPLDSVKELRTLGHDVVTVQETGHSNKGTPDDQVLKFATDNERTVVTTNRRDFIRLHKTLAAAGESHAGIVTCTEDHDFIGLAARIDTAIKKENEQLAGKLLSVYRPV